MAKNLTESVEAVLGLRAERVSTSSFLEYES